METDKSKTVTTNYHRMRQRMRERATEMLPEADARRKYRMYLLFAFVAVVAAVGIGAVLSGLALLFVMSISQQPLLIIGAGLMVGFGAVSMAGVYIWLTL